MKIYIIGAGAIGKTLAVCLALNGKDVQLIRGSVDDGNTYKEKLTVKLKAEQELTAEVAFNSLSNYSELNGLVILTTKSFGNRELSKKLVSKAIRTPIVILQNGLGIEQPFIEKGFKEVYRCVLFATSQSISKNKVRYKPVAESPIGAIRQNSTFLDKIVEEIDTPDFRFVTEKYIDKIIWKKAIANCVFNSICPLLEVDNGIFHRNTEAFSLAKKIIAECVLVSSNKGIDLEAKEIEDQVISISKMSDGQFISTLQDIRSKRETEIDTLNFEIYSMAKQMNLGLQVQRTKLLGDLIKIKSGLNR
ncbi:ketopantoate reductase family protein [Sinomicrobium pectinilyticum]|uniref:2-dehydropantoate 2-reductase n=1 Tax=Sinomicrobium pectinilyticum TaxID=1084421 RepID=A0A3N0DHX1_SINP1|nr:2-dehydropantoate 2-reductase [Sinomicrobium pectinilyticum]RNL75292.1 ketopantoate reductase family protein [Sinomicrobium pectinilyticum]